VIYGIYLADSIVRYHHSILMMQELRLHYFFV